MEDNNSSTGELQCVLQKYKSLVSIGLFSWACLQCCPDRGSKLPSSLPLSSPSPQYGCFNSTMSGHRYLPLTMPLNRPGVERLRWSFPSFVFVFVWLWVFLYLWNRSGVERLTGSLLGGQDEKMTVKEKCLYEYNLTLSFESTMGRWPTGWSSAVVNSLIRTVMLDWWGVELICSVLRPDMDVLEYGSGGSTTFFRWSLPIPIWNFLSVSLWKAGRAWSMTAIGCQRWIFLISNIKLIVFLFEVKNTLKMLPWANKVTLHHVARDLPTKSFEGSEEEYRCSANNFFKARFSWSHLEQELYW